MPMILLQNFKEKLAIFLNMCYNVFNLMLFYNERRKEITMATPKFDIKKSTGKVDNESEVEVPKEQMTHSSLGLYRGDDGWYVVEVRFNPKTKQTGEMSYHKAGMERETAIDLFRIMSVNLNIVG